MDIKIIKLITTRHDHVDGNNNPSVESTIIGIVDVHEDITDLIDLYHEEYRMTWDSPYTPEEFKNMCEEKIETEVISLSTVQELVNTKLTNNRDRQNGELKSGWQALEELKTKLLKKVNK
jgi:hypothetical protein